LWFRDFLPLRRKGREGFFCWFCPDPGGKIQVLDVTKPCRAGTDYYGTCSEGRIRGVDEDAGISHRGTEDTEIEFQDSGRKKIKK